MQKVWKLPEQCFYASVLNGYLAPDAEARLAHVTNEEYVLQKNIGLMLIGAKIRGRHQVLMRLFWLTQSASLELEGVMFSANLFAAFCECGMPTSRYRRVGYQFTEHTHLFLKDKIRPIITVLEGLDIDQELWQVFVSLPARFVERIVRAINNKMKAHAFANVDKTLLVAVMYDFEKMASSYLEVDVELQVELASYLEGKTILKYQKHARGIMRLLMSPMERERRNGEVRITRLN